MDVQATRLELIKLLLDEKRVSVLEKITALLTKEDEIVAYTTSGEPLTHSDYNERLEKGEQQIKSGQFLTQEDLEKEMKSW